MRFPEKRFSVPFSIFEDRLPGQAFRLLCFLLSQSDFTGHCSPGYAKIKAMGIGSEHTIAVSLRLLQKKGWIFHRKLNGSGNETFWMQIPPRYRKKRAPKSPISVLQ